MKNQYDSTMDTINHKVDVSKIMNVIIHDINNRKVNHDSSKLESPEKEGYDKYIPLLKETPYGSKEYEEVRKEMEESCLNHHYQVNRHHPEHFKNGIKDFTIVDLVEYFCDTYAASLRSDTPYEKGLKINANKHNLPEELIYIFTNTVKEYFE